MLDISPLNLDLFRVSHDVIVFETEFVYQTLGRDNLTILDREEAVIKIREV
jgi:hypothetical protein